MGAMQATGRSGSVIGIDIGGTKINAAIMIPGESSPEKALNGWLTSPTPKDADTFLNTLVNMVLALQEKESIAAVGISTAGVVDPMNGEVLGSTGNVPALQKLRPLQQLLEKEVRLPVHIENDANAAAYGEYIMGAAKTTRNMFAVTLGTGVGMGLICEGRLYRGAHFFAGEGGHIAISHTHQRKCTCGRWDCWEAFASGTGLNTTAELALESASESVRQEFLQAYSADGQALTYAVVAACKDKNRLGQSIMDDWHHHVSVGVSSLINVLDPDAVVIGGGLAPFVNFDLLTERVRERSMSNNFQLLPAILGNHAGLVGAGYLALESLRIPV